MPKLNHSWEGDWINQRKLGRGAQGTTHLLTSRADPERHAVLKTLNSPKSDQARMRFRREILSLLELGELTDAVPKVLSQSDESAATPFFIMEHVAGETLQDYVITRTRLDPNDSMRICRSLCSTLALAHRVPILHRDIKPDNIIIANGNPQRVILVDFGLAYTSSSTITETEETFRNRFLLLPETASGGQDKRDHRSDITCVVGILYFCLTGKVPEQLLDATGRQPHRRVPLGIPGLKPDSMQHASWLALFDKGFEYQPENRFQSFDQLLSYLDTVERGALSLPPVSIEATASKALEFLRAQDVRQFWVDEQKPKLDTFWRRMHVQFESYVKRATGFKVASFSGGGAMPIDGFDLQFSGGFTVLVPNFTPTACIRHAVGYLDRQVVVFVGSHRSETNPTLYIDSGADIAWRRVTTCNPDDLAGLDLSELDSWASSFVSESLLWIVNAIRDGSSGGSPTG